MKREQLELLCYIAQKKELHIGMVDVVTKDLYDMGLVVFDGQTAELSGKGILLIQQLAAHIKVGPVVPTAGAIRILMNLAGNEAPREISLYGAAQLAGVGWVKVTPDEVVGLTASGMIVVASILNFIKDK